MPDPTAQTETGAVEMTGRGKRGKPNPGFPLFPPPLEIAGRFPHSHRLDDESLVRTSNHRHRIVERSPYLVPVISASFRLIFQLEYAGVLVGHNDPSAENFESGLNFLQSCVMVWIQHPAHNRFPDIQATRQLGLADPDFTNGPVEGELSDDP